MNKYEKIFQDYKKNLDKKAEECEECQIQDKLKNISDFTEKAQVLLDDRVQEVDLKVICWTIIVIIFGNIFINPPMLFHSYGHFGILSHPIVTFKQLYFGWGPNLNSFILSLTGLKHYFSMIPTIYSSYGFLKATFAYVTQFSPIWAFLPLRLLFGGITNSIKDSILSEKENLAKYLEEIDNKELTNE